MQCDNGYCCSKDGPNGDCPKNAIDALSTDDTTEYRCVQERDVLSKNSKRIFFEEIGQSLGTEYQYIFIFTRASGRFLFNKRNLFVL